MKKFLMVVSLFVMVFAMVGCGNNKSTFESAKIRVDTVTAAQVGKAVRIWDVEYNSNMDFKKSVDNSGSVLSTNWTKVSDLGEIEVFLDINSTNLVLEGAEYYVAKTADESYKIVVGISNNGGADLSNPKDVNNIDEYDGTSSAIVWIEPDEGNVE